jgi:hypothetical protein
MSYFAKHAEPVPYKCRGCGGWFIEPKSVRISCTVLHAEGTCCHVGEKAVEAPPPAAIHNS